MLLAVRARVPSAGGFDGHGLGEHDLCASFVANRVSSLVGVLPRKLAEARTEAEILEVGQTRLDLET